MIFNLRILKIKGKHVVIKDYVRIGENVIILAGVTIGNNSEIISGSVVAKNVLPDSIFGVS